MNKDEQTLVFIEKTCEGYVFVDLNKHCYVVKQNLKDPFEPLGHYYFYKDRCHEIGGKVNALFRTRVVGKYVVCIFKLPEIQDIQVPYVYFEWLDLKDGDHVLWTLRPGKEEFMIIRDNPYCVVDMEI